MVKYLTPISMLVKLIASFSFMAIISSPCIVFSATKALIDPTMSSDDSAAVGLNAESSNEPVLQSVLISPNRKIAVINGKTFMVGEKIGDATLIKVSDHNAVLRNGNGTIKTLNMHPRAVKIVIVQPRASYSGQN